MRAGVDLGSARADEIARAALALLVLLRSLLDQVIRVDAVAVAAAMRDVASGLHRRKNVRAACLVALDAPVSDVVNQDLVALLVGDLRIAASLVRHNVRQHAALRVGLCLRNERENFSVRRCHLRLRNLRNHAHPFVECVLFFKKEKESFLPLEFRRYFCFVNRTLIPVVIFLTPLVSFVESSYFSQRIAGLPFGVSIRTENR